MSPARSAREAETETIMTPDTRSRVTSWTVGVTAALLLYVLSFGPVVGWVQINWAGYAEPPAWYTTLYAPLNWAYKRNPNLRTLLYDYIVWWEEFFAKRKPKAPPPP